MAEAPSRYESYLCYYRVGVAKGALGLAATRLERQLTEGKAGGWPLLVRAHVATAQRESLGRTGSLYEEAANRLAADGQALGEVLARTNLRRIRVELGDRAGADEQVARALRAAERSGNAEAVIRASVLEASHLSDLGQELGRAHRALLRAEAAAFPDGPGGLQQSVLRRFANLSYQLGRHEEAVEKLERLRALNLKLGDVSDAPAVLYNLLNVRRAQREERPVPGSFEELRGLAEETLASAQEHKDDVHVARAREVLADLLARSEPERAAEQSRLCVEGARRLEARLPEMACLWSEARRLAAAHRPEDARHALDRATRIALSEGNPLFEAYAWQARLRASRDTEALNAAAKDSLQALTAIERLRAAQPDAQARIGVFANWTKDYYWLAGRFLTLDPPDADLALQVAERMRARVLLEALEAAGIARGRAEGAEGPTDEVRARLVAVQRRLLDPGLALSVRQELLAQLERLEADERALRARPKDQSASDAARASFVSIDEIRRLLHPDELVLLFLVGLDQDLYGGFGGGSWLLALTKTTTAVHKIPDRLRLEATVPVFGGLVNRRDGSETQVAAVLHRELLGPVEALRDPSVRRLTIVSDGVLHELPFAALRPARSEEPLGTRYEMALVPSATLWARWRASSGPKLRAAALVVADPEIAAQAGARSLERDAILTRGLDVGPLPYARREGHRVRRAIGGESHVLAGPGASEAAFKAVALGPFGLVHFATHAVADEAYPERSAVVLASGSATEDGLLQPPEVSTLDLDRRAVVLSACRTAAGPVASGEGVLSLARSFFEAGARTVVATRWRLRDDEGERFFGWFYGHLSQGETMGAALRMARSQAVSAGLPAATWAGVDLLGDPDLSLGVRPPSPWLAAPRLLFVAAILGLLAWSLRAMARRARLRPPPVS